MAINLASYYELSDSLVTNLLTQPVQVYAGATKVAASATLLTGSNGANPQIKQLSVRDANQFLERTTKTRIYSVRLIKRAAITALVSTNNGWWLSFDNGVTREMAECIDIQDYRIAGAYWRVTLAL